MKFTALALAAASVVSGQILCTPNWGSPLLEDCLKAFAKLPVPPTPRPDATRPQPVMCPAVYAPRWTIAEAGTCRIETYSSVGGAACIDPISIRQAAEKILKGCIYDGKKVEGGAQISASGTNTNLPTPVYAGVRIVLAPSATPPILNKKGVEFKA